jgi:hypothetical protein
LGQDLRDFFSGFRLHFLLLKMSMVLMLGRTRDAGDSRIRFIERAKDDAPSQLQSAGLLPGALDFTFKEYLFW